MLAALSHPRLPTAGASSCATTRCASTSACTSSRSSGEQRVLINVDLYVPLALSTPREDELDEVVDYDFIRRTIAERVERGPHPSAGNALRRRAAALLAHPQVRAARVSTEKPDVYPDCDAVGVEVFRIKEERA